MARHIVRNAKFFCGINGTGFISCQFQDGRWYDFPNLPAPVFSALAITLSQQGVEYDDVSRVFGSPKPVAADLTTESHILAHGDAHAMDTTQGDGFQLFNA